MSLRQQGTERSLVLVVRFAPQGETKNQQQKKIKYRSAEG